MGNNLESLLRDLISPIINEAIDKAIAKHFTVPIVPQTVGKDLLNVEEAAEFLKVSRPTVYGYIQNNKISYSKAGKRVYFKMDDLYKYLTIHRHVSFDETAIEANEYLLKWGKK